MKFEKSCGAIVYRENNDIIEYLVISHKSDKHWCFPKGHVENNESEIETALREVLEETGLNIELVEGFRKKIKYHTRRNTIKEVVFFLGESDKNQTITLQATEISDFRWASFDKILDMLPHQSSRKLLVAANSFLQENNK